MSKDELKKYVKEFKFLKYTEEDDCLNIAINDEKSLKCYNDGYEILLNGVSVERTMLYEDCLDEYLGALRKYNEEAEEAYFSVYY